MINRRYTIKTSLHIKEVIKSLEQCIIRIDSKSPEYKHLFKTLTRLGDDYRAFQRLENASNKARE